LCPAWIGSNELRRRGAADPEPRAPQSVLRRHRSPRTALCTHSIAASVIAPPHHASINQRTPRYDQAFGILACFIAQPRRRPLIAPAARNFRQSACLQSLAIGIRSPSSRTKKLSPRMMTRCCSRCTYTRSKDGLATRGSSGPSRVRQGWRSRDIIKNKSGLALSRYKRLSLITSIVPGSGMPVWSTAGTLEARVSSSSHERPLRCCTTQRRRVCPNSRAASAANRARPYDAAELAHDVRRRGLWRDQKSPSAAEPIIARGIRAGCPDLRIVVPGRLRPSLLRQGRGV